MKNGHQGAGLVSCVQFPIIKGDAVKTYSQLITTTQ